MNVTNELQVFESQETYSVTLLQESIAGPLEEQTEFFKIFGQPAKSSKYQKLLSFAR